MFKLLVVRFPGNAAEHPASSDFVINLMRRIAENVYPQIATANHLWIDDTPVTMSRNRAVKFAMANAYDYLLMIDSDMQPDLYPGKPRFFDAAWGFMMGRRQAEVETLRVAEQRGEGNNGGFAVIPPATIGAPYCGAPPDESCFVFEWKHLGDGERFKLGMIPREAAAVRSGIQEVAALPTGLILYDLRTFLVLPKPWFAYEYDDDEETVMSSTEDVVQTRNASQLGMPQFCAWDCWSGHVKRKIVGKPLLFTPDIISDKLKKAMQAMPANGTVRFQPGEPGPAETGPSVKLGFSLNDSPLACDVPPKGWYCTRPKGHKGPCAAVEIPDRMKPDGALLVD